MVYRSLQKKLYIFSLFFLLALDIFLSPLHQVYAVDLGACTGSSSQQGFCTTTAPSGSFVPFYQDKVPDSQCGINATKANAARGLAVYCCTAGASQYATCGSGGVYKCTTSCSASNISYTDHASATQCGINATKANLARGTVIYCMCDSSKQTCPTLSPTSSPLVGDVNNDGTVNVVDYSLIIGCYGDKFGTSDCVAGSKADINNDGVVDGIDYNIWLRAFIGVE